MRKVFALAIFLVFLAPISTRAAEFLVIYTTPHCPYCVAWWKQIGHSFHDLPIKEKHIYPGMYAPTFMVEDDTGRELGVIVGYSDPETWWYRFRKIMKRIKK